MVNSLHTHSLHDALPISARLQAIHGLFGQIPDTLEDVWVHVANHDEQAARQLIDRKAATRKDRKSTRLNSSHGYPSYALDCLNKIKRTDPRDSQNKPR